MKTYDFVKKLLEEDKSLRNSDKKLFWVVWKRLGYINNDSLTFESFTKPSFPYPETIRRSRQKVQELNPHLRANDEVLRARKKKQASKGTFVFRDEVQYEEVWKNGYKVLRQI